jgi:hypothetical protein
MCDPTTSDRVLSNRPLSVDKQLTGEHRRAEQSRAERERERERERDQLTMTVALEEEREEV